MTLDIQALLRRIARRDKRHWPSYMRNTTRLFTVWRCACSRNPALL
ncbi:MAG: hypothetical protein H6672_20880 [Anaerolineaceae bacterium]|nr:hypothetical protein [Anaerolineaceae bacterium]